MMRIGKNFRFWLCAMALPLMLLGCPEAPSSVDISGTWQGEIFQTSAGSLGGLFEAQIVQTDNMINGTWYSDFSSTNHDTGGTLSGVVNGAYLFAVLEPGDEDGCPLSLTATISGNELEGSFSTMNCVRAISGSVALRRGGSPEGEDLVDANSPELLGSDALVWQRAFVGVEEAKILPADDGGYFVVGKFTDDWRDVGLLKLNARGLEQWRTLIGGDNGDYARDAIRTEDGGLLIVGGTNSYGPEGSNVYAVKVDSEGNTEWAQGYGGERTDYGTSVTKAPAGGYLIGGIVRNETTEDDALFVRIGESGEELWTKTHGGTEKDMVNAVVAVPQGGFAAAGFSDSFGAIREDMYVIRMDDNGDLLWFNLFGALEDDRAFDILAGPDGTLFALGCGRQVDRGSDDAYVVAIGQDGQEVWSRWFGALGVDDFRDGILSQSGNLLMIGSTKSFGLVARHVYLVEASRTGALVRHNTIRGVSNNAGISLAQTQDGSIVFTGETYNDRLLVGKTTVP